MPTKEKEDLVAVLREKITKAESIIIADHTGINVNDLTVLRRDLRNAKAELRVAKNTLLSRAARDAGMAELAKLLAGPTSMIFGFDDPSVPARIILEYQKKTEKPRIRGYVLGRRLLAVEDFMRIAQLPARQQVLAQLIGSMNSPILGFVMTLDGMTRNFIGLVDALAENRK